MNVQWETPASFGIGEHPVQVLGNRTALDRQLIGFFAASHAPSDLILPTLDLMLAWPASGPCLLSGFQSPLEQAALEVLLAGESHVVAALAAPLKLAALPSQWRHAISEGRLTLLWEDHQYGGRVSEKTAELRNRLVVSLSSALFVVSGGTSSRAYRMATAGTASGRRLLCHQHPRERDLLLLGGEPLEKPRNLEQQIATLGSVQPGAMPV